MDCGSGANRNRRGLPGGRRPFGNRQPVWPAVGRPVTAAPFRTRRRPSGDARRLPWQAVPRFRGFCPPAIQQPAAFAALAGASPLRPACAVGLVRCCCRPRFDPVLAGLLPIDRNAFPLSGRMRFNGDCFRSPSSRHTAHPVLSDRPSRRTRRTRGLRPVFDGSPRPVRRANPSFGEDRTPYVPFGPSGAGGCPLISSPAHPCSGYRRPSPFGSALRSLPRRNPGLHRLADRASRQPNASVRVASR